MMDTILNLGLNDRAVEGLARKTGNERFAWDCYRRFIQMFASVVMDFEKKEFEHIIEALKHKRKVKLDTQLTSADLQALTLDFKRHVRKRAGRDFPQDAREQLAMARDAVFRSWNTDRAIYYRKQNGIPDDLGTAVNVQAMVFGNMGDTSGTGVGFTRNPSTGENHFYGEYLTNAQGEDVVAGVRTPHPIDGPRRRRCPRSTRSCARSRRAREALPRRAGLRVHDPGRQALPAADAQRQAHRAGRRAHRGGHGEGGPDHRGGGHPARRARVARPAAAPAPRSRRPRSTSSPAACRPRRAPPSAGGLRRGHGGGDGPRQEEGHPRPQGDHAGRHPRHGRGAGHPDRDRRHDQPRGRRRARHGQAVRLGRERDPRAREERAR